jgi:threonine synthase
MKFVSTRNDAPTVGLVEAIDQGLAPDGGLYVPDQLADLSERDFGTDPQRVDVALAIARSFAPDLPEDALREICDDALAFPTPLTEVDAKTEMLELFHGPTGAFKDVGARFLAAFMTHPEVVKRQGQPGKARTILVATSGDTGGAVAAAFWKRPGVRVLLLFPKDGVSPRQAHQLSAWGENVSTYAVDGTFDACQRMVKEAFADPALRAAHGLSSANSINLGRLLPQTFYYAWAALNVQARRKHAATFVVPSGNLGNATAALWARAMGFPIAQVAMATNANRVFVDYLEKGEFSARDSVPTLANAMDVGNPSNLERIQHLFPDLNELRAVVPTLSVDDEVIKQTIRNFHGENGWAICPHTATGITLREKLAADHAVVVATAHPAKFESVVEPLIEQSLALPPALAEVLARSPHAEDLAPTLDALKEALDS